jgi:hypothetical protein
MPSFFDEYYPYREHIDNGQYSRAVDTGLQLLNGVRQLAPKEYETAHKGTPLYVMGFGAFLSHDYETATFLFDAAVSEDLKNYPAKTDSPALLFMQLDDNNPNHLAKELVTHVRKQVDILVQDYNARPGASSITLSDLRTHFLGQVLSAGKPHLRTLTTTFITFVAEWYFRARLMDLGAQGSREPFFSHLFKGCLLFESLLKENPKNTPTQESLGRILNNDLASDLSISQVDVREQQFESIVSSLVPNMGTTALIECTGKTRNTLGHNLVWMSASLNANTYDLLVKNVAAACIHAISKLYR